MDLQELLSDPVKDLEKELGQIDEKRKLTAKKGDTGTLQALTKRKAELPALIHQAKLRDIGKRIAEQKTRLRVFEMELQEAREVAHKLGTELPSKITALNQQIERLRNETQSAMATREALQFVVAQETGELDRLKKEKETLLLSQAFEE